MNEKHDEEEYFHDQKKQSRAERKRLSAKDRSKYKKTDQDKIKQQEAVEHERIIKENLLQGRVLSVESEGITVENQHNQYICTLRGVLKKEKGKLKNLVIVGDIVRFEAASKSEGVIVYVEPRKTVLSRADNISRQREQLIAANVDQVLITASVVSPPLKPFLIDRYIIAARKGGMEPVIVVNKIDLLKDHPDETSLFEGCCHAYEKANIPVISMSALEQTGMEALLDVMKGKTSVFSGQSGVGKSSLINAVTGLNLEVGDVVERTRKGKHTTTRAHLIPLKCGGWCIDTPGIKSFGVWDLQDDEIEAYYEEIQAAGEDCKFSNCSHTHEVNCAVKESVANGSISSLRYDSYFNLKKTINQEHRRR